MKSVQLTNEEIQAVIKHRAEEIVNNGSEAFVIDRIKYLHKRLGDGSKEITEVKPQGGTSAW